MSAERVYAAVLRLYPKAFREEYHAEMRALFRHRWRTEHGTGARATLWMAVLVDAVATAAREHMSMLTADVRYALRTLRKAPAFTLAVLASLALGIGAATAIYSLVHTVLLRPLPFAEPQHLVRITEANSSLNISEFAVSVPNLVSWQERSQSFEALAAVQNGTANLTGDGEPQRAARSSVSPTFWTMTGITPILGRSFTAEEGVTGHDRVTRLSEGLWRRRYGGDSGILGQAILLGGEPHVVVGIAPQDVGYSSTVDLWTPFAPNLLAENRGDRQITVLGRLRRGISIDAASAELNGVAADLAREFPKSNAGWNVQLTPVASWIVNREVRTQLYMLLAAAGLLLAAACANVAGLLVTRATTRTGEFGVRLALGANRARITRQLATESLVLATMGGALGVAMAFGATQWLSSRVATQLPRAASLSLDWPALGFALVLTMVVGLLFGVAPSWSARQANVNLALKQAGRGASEGAGATARLILVGGQMAVATLLAVAALLLLQSYGRLQRVDPGFQADHLLTARLSLPAAQYPREKAEAFYRTLLADIRTMPGVISAGVTSGVPLAGGNTSMSIVPLDRQAAVPEQGVQASWRWTSDDYLATLRVPLIRGRFFVASDAGRRGIILSEQLAHRLWPDGADPIDRQIRLGDRVYSVVGIVGDVRLTDLRAERSAMYFQPVFAGNLTLAIRTSVEPASLVGPLRESVKRLDPSQPLFSIRTMEDILEASTERPLLQTTILTSFACLALLLGMVGVAGVVAYSVERRTPELAVRLALGATPAQAVRTAARDGVTASTMGLMLGLAAAWGLKTWTSALLYEVKPDDPLTFAAVAGVLLTVVVASCWLPARRATRIDPALALRPQ